SAPSREKVDVGTELGGNRASERGRPIQEPAKFLFHFDGSVFRTVFNVDDDLAARRQPLVEQPGPAAQAAGIGSALEQVQVNLSDKALVRGRQRRVRQQTRNRST